MNVGRKRTKTTSMFAVSHFPKFNNIQVYLSKKKRPTPTPSHIPLKVELINDFIFILYIASID